MAWHLVTCEYPPQVGGVSDYTRLVAKGLAGAGDEVHVWCPSVNGANGFGERETDRVNGLLVHRELGGLTIADLRRADRLLDQCALPRRLLVQWVPHGYGYQSMNLPFCLWLWRRAVHSRDHIEFMVHEPFLAFGEGSLKQNTAALAHRIMMIVLLRAAKRVWVSIPDWEQRLRPYSSGRRIPFSCLPVPSNVPVVNDEAGVTKVRRRYAPAGCLIGHFGTYGREVSRLLMTTLPALLSGGSDKAVLLLGQRSEWFRDQLTGEHRELNEQVFATGPMASADISRHLAACDVMFQPYPDGINGRHGSAMAALAHGLPVVTTVGPLTEDFWIESRAGALASVKDTKGMTELVERLIEDSTKRVQLGNAARVLYEQRFDVRHTIEALRGAAACRN